MLSRSAAIRAAAILAVLALTGAARAQTPGFWLIPLQPGQQFVGIYWLSRNGDRAAGGVTYVASNRGGDPFVWTPQGGQQLIPDGDLSIGTDIRGMSDDGLVIAGNRGQRGVANSARPYRRVGSGAFESLPTPAGFLYSFTWGMSDDGNVVAGTWWKRLSNGSTSPQPFVWTPDGGMALLGQLSYEAQTGAVSRDGTTVVGGRANGTAFVWRQQTGMQTLPPPPVPGISWNAGAVNTDGTVIAGEYSPGTGGGTIRWINGIPQDLGIQEGMPVLGPVAISDDGTIIAGTQNLIPAVWSERYGFKGVADYFQLRGMPFPPGLTPYELTAMSPDGRTFAGYATLNGSDGAYVITLPPECGSADFNNDSDTGTDLDIETFFACIAGECCPTCGSPDFNHDGDIATDSDIEAFFRVLAGGTC